MSSDRWNEVTPSPHAHEREGLGYIRENLPDHEPYTAWTNFEFTAADGSSNEVDLLLITPEGFFLIELKAWQGHASGDQGTWTFRPQHGAPYTKDSPLPLANSKAKKLKSLLDGKKAAKGKRLPFLNHLVFLSHASAPLDLEQALRYSVFLRDRPSEPGIKGRPGIIAAVKRREGLTAGAQRAPRIDKPMAKVLRRAIAEIGIRPSQRGRKAGDYRLGELIYESAHGLYQDFEAEHASLSGVKRRVRIYHGGDRLGTGLTRDDVRRAAEREFRLLEGLAHPGILKAETLTDHVLGPALVFDRDPNELRLDQFIEIHGATLGIDDRLALVRQIAEALDHAHRHNICHRALSPQNILIRTIRNQPRAMIMNWQVGSRDRSTTLGTRMVVTPTMHVTDLIEEKSAVYLAPETAANPGEAGIAGDIFSLGAVAFHIFSGAAPASDAASLLARLKELDSGLDLSSVMDGVGETQRDLIAEATDPEVELRSPDVAYFLGRLEWVEEELTAPDLAPAVHPERATKGDRLADGSVVVSRLGTGGTATVFLVDLDDKRSLLKVASNDTLNARVRDEGEVLSKLRHHCVIQLEKTVEIDDLTALRLKPCGTETLASRLRKEGSLSLDLLHRFGNDLLSAMEYLEEQGVAHRDIKPDNLAVGPRGRGDPLHVTVFDFSLSKTSPDELRVGTPGYLDPFLAEREQKRWDGYAERYSAAVTLHEMATGTLPRWGDGQSDPAFTKGEVNLEPRLFDASVRDGLDAFFHRALRRAPEERFDNAEEMRHQWLQIFLGQPATSGTDHEDDETVAGPRAEDLEAVELATGLADFGSLSNRAINALEREQVLTVGELLAVPSGRFHSIAGVGAKTRREILAWRKALDELFPDAGQEPAPETEDEWQGEADTASLDRILPRLAPMGRGKSADAGGTSMLRAYLRLDHANGLGDGWPTQVAIAEEAGVSQPRANQVIQRARHRWFDKERLLTAARNTLLDQLTRLGSVAVPSELASGLLQARGSLEREPARTRTALAIVRACVDAESRVKEPRFLQRRHDGRIVIATTQANASYALALGKAADQIANTEPLPTPARALEALREVTRPDGVEALPDARMVRLGAAASATTACSSRLELYPRSMPAQRALRLAQGALFAGGLLKVADIQARVRSRYPASAPLPERPELDRLVEELQLGLEWRDDESGTGYVSKFRDSGSLSSLSNQTRFLTGHIQPTDDPDVVEARRMEDRLRRSEKDGGFLALMVEPRFYQDAARELSSRFKVDAIDGDSLWSSAMHAGATANNVDWNVIVAADEAGPQGPEWSTILHFVEHGAKPHLREAINGRERTVLLTYPGLFGRYDQIGLLEEWRDLTTRDPGEGGLHGIWVLLPAPLDQELPSLGRHVVPVIGPSQWGRLHWHWTKNRHRGGIRPEREGTAT